MAVISQTAGKQRNYWASLTRVMRSCWFGETVTVEEIPPIALNNENINVVNAAGTGVSAVLKSDASNVTCLLDANGNEVVKGPATTSAVNEITVTNAATGNAVQVASTGGDTNIGLDISSKGTGSVTIWTGAKSREALILPNVASAVNEVTITMAATGNGPSIAATGGDTNVPITLAGKGTGHVVLGQATSTDVRLAADQPIGDSSGNELVKFTKAASAINEVTVANAAAGSGPSITATGGDTNVPVTLAGKGTGAVKLGQATSVGVDLLASQPIRDANLNELIAFSATGSAVNEITITNAATGNAVLVAATGGDTNVGLDISSKGTGSVTLWTGNKGREALICVDTASAVNEFTITPAATGAAPALSVTGGDTNVGMTLSTKGTGNLVANVNSVNRLLANGVAKTIVDGSATSLFEVTCTAAQMVGGLVVFLIRASDATDHQAISGIMTYSAVNKAGTITADETYATANEAKAVSAGTLTLAWTVVDSTNKITVKLQPTGSLTETTYEVMYTIIPIVGAVTIL